MSEHDFAKNVSAFYEQHEQLKLPIDPPVQKEDRDYLVPQTIRQTAVNTDTLDGWVNACDDILHALADKDYGEVADLLTQLRNELLESQ